VAHRRPTDDDIAAARVIAARVAVGADVARAALAASVRTVCALLAHDHPGSTLEVRVPPFAAVQAGLGERGAHTRGTPPNVVEADAVTMLNLASGALAWADAMAEHRVHASGAHVNMGPWFPCL